MKKIISIIAAIAIAMSFTTAFAANADNMQEVLVSVKERIDVPEEYSEFENSQRTIGNIGSYNFSWRKKEGDKSINVTAYGDGIITRYSKYADGYRSSQPSMNSMSASEAKLIAEEFLNNINPDYPYEFEIGDAEGAILYSDNRYFPVKVYVNGIPMENDGGTVCVNTAWGEVSEFYIWYVPEVEIDYESNNEFISEKEAKQAYSDKLGMKLIYRSYYDDNKEVFYPVYVQKSYYNQYINALTGDIEEAGYYATSRAGGYSGMAETSMTAKESGLTEQELTEIDKINGLISKTDIEQQIRNNKILNVPTDIKVDSVYLRKNGDEYIYDISMNKATGDYDYAYAYISVDAKTGEIQSYYYYSSDMRGETDIEERNDDDFRALAGSKADKYIYDEESEQYQRIVNGIEVEGDTASIRYTDGVLTDYSISYSNAEFPSIDGAMIKEEAEKAFFEQTDYRTVCVVSYNLEEDKTHIVPVYSHEAASVNPFTGKLVNWRNEEITGDENAPITYSDISGHYAERYINALAEYSIGFEGGSFKPDEKITQADLLTLLTSVTAGGDIIVMFDNKEQADYAYSRAVRNNIITEDERDDNAIVTRETASIYLIRAIGAEEYAKYNDIYVTPFDDVTENKGYVALLNAMGVVHGDGTTHFNPKREITRAEFAVMLYNYLNI